MARLLIGLLNADHRGVSFASPQASTHDRERRPGQAGRDHAQQIGREPNRGRSLEQVRSQAELGTEETSSSLTQKQLRHLLTSRSLSGRIRPRIIDLIL
jgi:hypothetical protein